MRIFFKKHIKLIISLVAVMILITAALFCFLNSAYTVITLNGPETQEIEVFSEYNDNGFKATAGMWFISFDPKTETKGKVDTSKIGDYTVAYKSSFMGEEAATHRVVSVKDKTPPEIICDVNEYVFDYKDEAPSVDNINIKCSATDNYDGEISEKIVKTLEDYELTLTVSDSSGNTASHSVSIVINDGVQPTLSLSGTSPMYVKHGSSFKEPGFAALDNKDGNLTERVKVSGSVDTSKNGTYLLEYNVSDDAGNSVKRIRKVVVYSGLTAKDFASVPKNGKTVYLTFDDGPGPYTEKLLGYLDQYDVESTFFVTNQFPGYKHLIGEAYRRGHTIGVHTATHQWTIYKNKNNYLADFEIMQGIVEAQTGAKTDIFRFPGGTNNLISKKYKKGIMTELSKEMTDMGYVYFDWNVDCNDSRYNNAQRVIESTIEQISRKTNSVVLMHDIKPYTVEAVPAIIEYCLKNGYTFKALDKTSPACSFKPQN